MKMKSKIKSIFTSPVLLERLAAICDTNSIQNNQLKMDLVQRLLNREGIKTGVLGGATNRYVVTIEGYAVKIAVDDQGYKDNLMEFALTRSMNHTQNSYETNGYILVQETGRPVTIEEWQLRKHEIIRILDELGSEYLLGDVGYNDANFTNWVVTDDDELKICDYAYCHRLTEGLFTCPYCGSIMAYDEAVVHILCTDRANCHAKFSYNELKAIQGNEIDWQMIDEALKAAILIPEGQDYVEVEVKNTTATNDRTMYIKNYADLYLYNKLKEESEMVKLDYTNPEVSTLLRDLLMAKMFGDKQRIGDIENALHSFEKPLGRPIECIIDPEFQDIMEQDALDEEEARIYEESEYSTDYDDTHQYYSINDLILMASNEGEQEYLDEEEDDADSGQEELEYYDEEDDSVVIKSEDYIPLSEDVYMNGESIKAAVNSIIERDMQEVNV